MKKKPIAVGLFSNVRGIEIGAQRTDFYTPFSTDIEPDVREHFLHNYNKAIHALKETFYLSDVCNLTFADIKRELKLIEVLIDIGDIDCLVGCQSIQTKG